VFAGSFYIADANGTGDTYSCFLLRSCRRAFCSVRITRSFLTLRIVVRSGTLIVKRGGCVIYSTGMHT